MRRFLNKNCKWLMSRYYLWRHERDIFHMLSFMIKYKDVPMPQRMLIEVMVLDGWTLHRAMMTYGYCLYCGLIEQTDK